MLDPVKAGDIAPDPISADLAGGVLTVDLGALCDNWRTMRAASGAAECSAVVKANAYGTGQGPAVTALRAAGCRTFFVAHPHEAFLARAAAPDATVYVLNGLPPGAGRRLASAGVQPVLGSLHELAEWRREAGDAPAALHIDTGMERLGLTAREAAGAAAQGVGQISLVMSHFVASEEPDNSLNDRQIARFTELSALFPGVRRSLANSSGIWLPQAPHFDLTRPGYGLYGGNPTPNLHPARPNPMRPVVRLEARILQLRDIAPDDTVGYNARWRASGQRRIATLSAGYADGVFRSASVRNTGAPQTHTRPHTGGAALVADVLCPFAGNISMDLLAVDVTGVPRDAVQAGDMVTLIGDGLNVDEVAARCGTIGYETLTSLGQRYARHYVGAA